MGLREDYSRWPLGRQLQVTFIASTFLLAAILIIITRFQLDWLRDQIIDKSTTATEDNLLAQMRALGEVQANFIASEFATYMEDSVYLKDIELILQGYNPDYDPPPLVQSTAYQADDLSEGERTYDYGVFFSKNDLSDEGTELENKDTPLDKIYPILYNTKLAALYQGYETDEIIHFYPGITFESDYTPLVREWYYRAYDANGSIILTEPYVDANTEEWMVTSSLSFNESDDNIIGVAAVDVTLEQLTAKFSSVTILDTGYILLVSKGGMILVMPDEWKTSDDTLRIYDTDSTGISEEEWETFQTADDGSQHTFHDVNDTEIFMVKKNIYSDYTGENILYLFLCAKRDEMDEPTDDIRENFSKTYSIIFWVTVTIAIIVFLSIIALVYIKSRTTGNQLKLVEKIFAKIVRRGLFPKMTKGIYFNKLDNNSKGIESLVEACKEKVSKIREKEELHSYYKWGYTTPNDELLYNNWTNHLYPLNYYKDKPMGWRHVLPNLNKILG